MLRRINYIKSLYRCHSNIVTKKNFYNDIMSMNLIERKKIGIWLGGCTALVCGAITLGDDLKIYSVIKNFADNEKIQKDIDSIYEWSNKHNLPLNLSKCNVMHFTQNKNDFYPTLKIHNHVLPKITSVKDLGVTFTDDGKFDQHIERVVRAAKIETFRIKKTIALRQLKYLLLLFKLFILPKIEYASQVWNPSKKDIKRLES
ncbi:hypothetical protein A3Q56_04449, partial [Intoshia linei]